MSRKKRWGQYLLTAVLTLAPWIGWFLWAVHYTNLDNADNFPDWVSLTVIVPGVVILLAGVLVLLLALMFFWIWLIDIPGDSEMAAMEAEAEKEVAVEYQGDPQ